MKLKLMRAFVVLLPLACAATYAKTVLHADSPPADIPTQPEPAPTPEPKVEKLKACSVDIIVPVEKRRCYIGENRVGAFCSPEQQKVEGAIPRCTEADLSLAAGTFGDGRLTIDVFTLLRVARLGVAPEPQPTPAPKPSPKPRVTPAK